MSAPLAKQPSLPAMENKTSKILIADDEEFVCDLITKILTRHLKAEVVAVHDGAQAIAEALTGKYNCVLIDLVLPKTSGFKVINVIKTMKPDLPIIAMSTIVSEKNIKKYGLNSILQKPFKMTMLLERVAEALGVCKATADR